MREILIGKNDAGQRLDRFVSKAVPGLPAGLLQKYIRLKRVKCNGKRGQREQRLNEGDTVQLYINDVFFQWKEDGDRFYADFKPHLNILYEDENLLLVDKPPGLVVHADETEKVHTLLHHVQAYLYQNGAWDPAEEHTFTPALCNRVDRNTGGLVIAAKNAEALRILTAKIRTREITKKYLCVVLGRMHPPTGRLERFLLKDEEKKLVTVYRRPVPGGRSAVTLYRTVAVQGELSLVEAELLTGRTHQIRASFADVGHPLLGDGKYGFGDVNRRYGEKWQALYSYAISFDFPTDAGTLNYLRGRTFQVPQVPFVKKYFPEGNFTKSGAKPLL